MKDKRSLNLCILALLFSILIFGGLLNAADIDGGPTVKIGVIVPLTGDMGFAGEEVRDAMILAKERLGQTHYEYEIIFEDNGLDLKKSVTAAKKLIDFDKVDVVVTLWPPTANVVAPVTENAGVLQYTIAWDPQIARSHKYVLSHQAMVDAFVEATLKLLKSEGVKKLAFFQVNETGFNIGTEHFRTKAPEYGIELAYLDVFNAGQQDFRSELLKAAAKKVDGILVWAVMPELGTILKQIKQLRINAHVSGFFDALADPKIAEGLKYVSEVNSTEEFAALFKDRFGKTFSLKAPNAFDVVNLLVKAFEESPEKKPSSKELKERLTKVGNYHGAVGVVSIDQYGNSSYPPTFKQVENGVPKVVAFQ